MSETLAINDQYELDQLDRVARGELIGHNLYDSVTDELLGRVFVDPNASPEEQQHAFYRGIVGFHDTTGHEIANVPIDRVEAASMADAIRKGQAQ